MAFGSGKGEGGALAAIVIGGGQAGLAIGYYLRRSGLSFVIFDTAEGPGGAWRWGWDSLRTFSPARWSSLPGRLMPGGNPGAEDCAAVGTSVSRVAHYQKTVS